MRRFGILAVECCIGLIAGAALLVGIVFWRLTEGPVAIDFLVPYVEEALGGFEEDASVEVAETLLAWNPSQRAVEVRVRRAVARDAEGVVVASFPDVGVELSLRALAQGTFAPTEVEVKGARIYLVRDVDGRFFLGGEAISDETDIGVGAAKPQDEDDVSGSSAALERALNELMSQPDPDHPLAFLREVRIVGGTIHLDDRRSGMLWYAPDANVSLRRDTAGLAGEVDLSLQTGSERATLNGAFLYDKSVDTLDLAATLGNLSPAAIAPAASELRPLSGFSASLGASVSASMSLGGRVDFLRFTLTLGAGDLAVAGLLPDPLPVRGMEIKGRFDGPTQELVVDSGSLQLGSEDDVGPEINFAGDLQVRDGIFEASGSVETSNVKADDLGRYWPPIASPNAREWVLENVRRGIAEYAKVEVSASVPEDDLEAVVVHSVKGSMKYRGLDIHFLRPMPPISGVHGTASFDASGMHFQPAGGRLGDLIVHPTDVRIEGFDRDGPETMAIRSLVTGPVRDALLLLNHERLKLIDNLGINPEDTGGSATTELSFDFPLIAALDFDDIVLSAKAQVQDAAVKQVLFGQDATRGQLELDLTHAQMQLKGPVELGGVAGTLDWFEPFDSKLPTGSVIKALVPSIDNAGRERLGFDFLPYLDGPVSASVIYTARRNLPDEVQLVANLEAAKVAVEPLLWAKDPGKTGEIRAVVELVDDRATRIKNVELTAGDLTATGNVLMDDAGRDISEIFADSLRFGRTAVTAVHLRRLPGEVAVSIGGGTVDAQPYLARDPAKASAQGQSGQNQAPQNTTEEPRDAFSITTRTLDTLLFGEDQYLEAVTFSLQQSTAGWERIALDGEIPERFWTPRVAGEASEDTKTDTNTAEAAPQGNPADDKKRVSIDFRPLIGSKHSLRAKTNDMGAALRVMNILDTIEGGVLEVRGESDGPSPAFPIKASLQARDYRVVNAPVLAKVLTFGSLTGVLDTLSGDGIEFERLIGDFVLNDGVASSEMIRAYGAAIGLTAKGQVDVDARRFDIKGTVIPAYTVNRVLGKIPLLGTILTGGEGGGVLGVTYGVGGPFEEPEVSVNPLSALTPGFLRGLFEGEGEVTALPDERHQP
ncbi:AsmA-like C-terminal domain-containing protein [Pelagibius sp. Alg239-R121]|uniref:YhdP family protein n=1 Tax=Pelagibius sp. Alg239-R121 TaxID=2993448 RepID=UPI0024A69EC8|nr:AsmA-like C-terminal domain-containing protein [Pelagibius sp. Alg239-R121]